MNKVAALNSTEEREKTRAQSCLPETQRILRHLAADRRREERRRVQRPSIVAEVRTILQGA